MYHQKNNLNHLYLDYEPNEFERKKMNQMKLDQKNLEQKNLNQMKLDQKNLI